jgi:hypothetical protein
MGRRKPSLESHCCDLLTSELQQAQKDPVIPAAESKPVAALSAPPSSSGPQAALSPPYRHFLSTLLFLLLLFLFLFFLPRLQSHRGDQNLREHL